MPWEEGECLERSLSEGVVRVGLFLEEGFFDESLDLVCEECGCGLFSTLISAFPFVTCILVLNIDCLCLSFLLPSTSGDISSLSSE